MNDGVVHIEVDQVDFFVQNMFTRFPFKYGIASLTGLPHLFLRMRMRVDGRPVEGVCGEHLPPKWFTKDPDTKFEDDLPSLIRVVTHAADLARTAGKKVSFFELWRELFEQQANWAKRESVAPLLANLGISIVERALLDGICRHLKRPFHQVLVHNQLGIDLGLIHPELTGMPVSEAVLEKPLQKVIVRHTIGLGDALRSTDLSERDRANDGLPQSLGECMDTYGHRYFKVKLCGELDRDKARLQALAVLFTEKLGEDYQFTLDGNENFRTVAQFVEHWEAYQDNVTIRALMKQLLFVEQPLHRDVALDSEVQEALARWDNRPPMIIDESDASLDSLSRALALGYDGITYKSCKGIVKGLANAALLVKKRQANPEKAWILSGEDLCNAGPTQVLQDLCMMASLGIPHVERNGHHYFKGMSAYSETVQSDIQNAHADLYEWRPEGFISLRLDGGKVSTRSVTATHFGVGPLLSMDQFTPLENWKVTSISTDD